MSPWIVPEWPAAARVRALMSTRATTDADLRAALPAEPAWLRQVHGTSVIQMPSTAREGDAAVTRSAGVVLTIRAADCMPILLTDDAGSVIGAAHAGWRGLSAGVVESTVHAMGVPGTQLLGWLGPAISARVYEVGDEVRTAFVEKDAAAAAAFSPTRPGHWLLDLYLVARQRLHAQGVERIFGGGFCTYTDPARFHSFRRDGTSGRMAAFLWLLA
jgi:polyphenol oxidase